MKTLFTLLLTLVFTIGISAQSKLQGSILDAKTGEALIGATVQVVGTNDAAKTNEKGEFELKTNKKPPFTITAKYLGYTEQEYIIASLDVNFQFELRPSENLLYSVVVTARRRTETLRRPCDPCTTPSGRR